MAHTMQRSREDALRDLEGRRAAALQAGQIDNASLQAGANMCFYCGCCGLLSDELIETYVDPPKKHCDKCKRDIEAGLLDAAQDRMTQQVPKVRPKVS